jgi:cytochrome c2
VADSPEATDSLVKREPDAPAQDPIVSRSTSAAMLISAILLTVSLAWALYDESIGQRPWKGIQSEFVARYTRYLDSIKGHAGQTEKEIKESKDYQDLDEAAKAARAKVKPEIDQIDAEVRQVQVKLDAVTEPFQNQRGRLTVINYNVEIAQGSAKEKYRKQAEDKRKEIVAVEMPAGNGSAKKTVLKMDYPALEKTYNDLREQKAAKLGRKADLLKEPSELEKKRDDYLKNHLTGLGPAQIENVKRGLKNFDYSILGHQISVNEFNIVDRCEVCHLGIRSPLNIRAEDMAPGGPGKKPDALARAFVSHPDRELLETHKPDRFGCSSCHWGNGRATTSELKAHGQNKFWLWPMFEKENTEAGCQQCHAKDRVTQGAETLNLGRDLFYQRGCMGCHRYEGFDRETDALTNARQTISQFEDQITANEKQIRQDENPPEGASEDDVRKMKAHAESLRVASSLLAARIDQNNLQTKYLMQDQKKVGPNLKDVRLKLRQGWIPLWLKDPQAFRPGTKMPTFWRFSVDTNGDDEIKAISAYLWQSGFEGQAPAQQRGDAGAGKVLFETKGCLACHSIGDESNRMGGTFAANLTKVGEKANFEYIVRWIYNPRERWVPYCPKHRREDGGVGRDLTPADYAKYGKPFVFDTELHSKCPEDGAELQVQNMTVMPNFRLSEQEARDIASYLFSLSSPPAYDNAAFMEDPKLKEQGRQLIKQFGCAGCHEIKGFETEQRIGKELTLEGATPIERLDFALFTQKAEQGIEPLEALKKNTKEKEWYNHKGFFEHKLADPSIYDQGKEKDPKDRLRMPRPYLTDEWRNALTTFLLGSVGSEGANVPKTLFYDPQEQQRQDIQNGWWVIKKYNCTGCHSIQVGQRSVLMDLPPYQAGTQNELGQDGKDLLPPRLTSEGARVDPNWLLRFLHDPSLSDNQPATTSAPSSEKNPASAKGGGASADQTAGRLMPQPGADRNGVRPYLKVRMPTFNFSPNELQTLVRFFMALAGQQEPYIKQQLEPLTEPERQIAREMFTAKQCSQCHATGDPAHDNRPNIIAPNFLLAGQRLKPEWTFRWVPAPQLVNPGVGMANGMFKKEVTPEGERWVIDLINPPKDISDYKKDHVMLLVRYMFLMTPEEQRRFLSAAAPAANANQNKPKPAGPTGWNRSQKGERTRRSAFVRPNLRAPARAAAARRRGWLTSRPVSLSGLMKAILNWRS